MLYLISWILLKILRKYASLLFRLCKDIRWSSLSVLQETDEKQFCYQCTQHIEKSKIALLTSTTILPIIVSHFELIIIFQNTIVWCTPFFPPGIPSIFAIQKCSQLEFVQEIFIYGPLTFMGGIYLPTPLISGTAIWLALANGMLKNKTVMQKYLELNDNENRYNILKLVGTVKHFLKWNFIALNVYIRE